MAIAKGSRGVLYWKEESAYGAAPSGNYETLPFNSEALAENINTIQGEIFAPTDQILLSVVGILPLVDHWFMILAMPEPWFG